MRTSFLLLLGLLGCEADTPSSSAFPIDWEDFVVVATLASDYSVGALSAVETESWEVKDQLAAIAGDATVRSVGEQVIQLNRFNTDTVRVYPTRDWLTPDLEFSVGEQANPHDAAICADKLFISLYGRDYIGVYDLGTGHQLGQVDLTAFEDGDTIGPEASQLVVVDEHLYVALQRLNREASWADTGGYVAQVRCDTEEVTASWPAGGNTRIHPADQADRLLVTGRAFEEDPGGLWELDTTDPPLLSPLTQPTADQTIVGAAASGAQLVLLQVDQNDAYSLVCYDTDSGQEQPLMTLSSFVTDLRANARGEAWVATRPHWEDPAAPGGLLVVDIEDCAMRTDSPITTSLPPYALDFVEGSL
jgi:hypothetical protein